MRAQCRREPHAGGRMESRVSARRCPGPNERLGCVRSKAWHCVFSSQQNTSGFSGGSTYRPVPSRNFASNWGPRESSKGRWRWGLRFWLRQVRATLPGERPRWAAPVRVLQRARPGGAWLEASRTSRPVAAGREGLRPRPDRSRRPAGPARSERCDHLQTQGKECKTTAGARGRAAGARLGKRGLRGSNARRGFHPPEAGADAVRRLPGARSLSGVRGRGSGLQDGGRARLKYAGLRWTTAGANATVDLCAFLLSSRYEDYWQRRFSPAPGPLGCPC